MVVFSGTIKNRAGDFSAFNPKNGQAEYVIAIKGREPSVPFRIADHLIESISSKLAYDFFVDVRGSEDPVNANEAKVYGGGPSRDQGSFGLETTFETLFYASNPALFDRWTTELGDKKTADLIDLILWHGEFAYHHVNYNGPVANRHGTLGYEGQPRMTYDYWNTLDQLAAVCAGYHSFLKPHLPRATYLKYRDECRKRWQTYDRHKAVRHWTYSNKWVDEGFQEFNEMGNAFGQSVFSNLFMYLSEKEEADGQVDHIGQNAYATEGWAISNRGWLATVTFAPLGTQKVRVLVAGGKKPLITAKAGQTVTLELTAALNLDPAKPESGWVLVGLDDNEPVKVAVQETSPDSGIFRARYTLPSTGSKQLTVAYGYWGLGTKAICAVR